jgi:hypothetical protein
MPPVGLEPTIAAGERPQTYALDRTGTGTGYLILIQRKFVLCNNVQLVHFIGHLNLEVQNLY